MAVNTLHIASYNCGGLRQSTKQFIYDILDKGDIDILLIQETWLTDMNLHTLSALHDDYFSFGISSVPSDVILTGRPYGGLALLWRKSLMKTPGIAITPVETSSDRVLYMMIKQGNSEILIINVYLPVDNRSMTVVDYEYENCLTLVESVIEQHATSSDIIIAGDCNTDFSRRNAHARHLASVIDRNDLMCCWDMQHINRTHTYLSSVMTMGSCIDHFFVYENRSSMTDSLTVVGDGTNPSDHACLLLVYNTQQHMPRNQSRKHDNCETNNRIAWHKVTDSMCKQYSEQVSRLVTDLTIDSLCCDFLCENKVCRNMGHIHKLEQTVSMLNDVLFIAAQDNFPKCSLKKTKLPYWNVRIKPYKQDSIFWGSLWNQCGRPTHGVVYNVYKRVKRQYHNAVRELRREEDQLRKQRMLEQVASNQTRDLWSEMRKLSPSANHTTEIIDGVTDPKQISDVFAAKYETLLNSVPSSNLRLGQLCDTLHYQILQEKDVIIDANDIIEACKRLKQDKHDGHQEVWSNMVSHAPITWYCILAKCFKGMLMHGHYPSELLVSTMCSLPKDLRGNLTTSDNYRGICLTSTINKLFDILILRKFSKCFKTHDLQFAFKESMSTSMCTMVIKDVARYYMNNGGKVYTCLLDLSKAFDRLRLDHLFTLLYERGLPAIIIRLLMDSYRRQVIQARWQGHSSDYFSVSNGVKQGGVASPVMFTLYVDVLLQQLEEAGVGCFVGHYFYGSICYADDVTLLAPTPKALQLMLKTCENFRESMMSYSIQKD